MGGVSDRIKELSRPSGEEEVLPVPRPRVAVQPRQLLWVAAAVALVLGYVAFSPGRAPLPEAPEYQASVSEAPSEIVVAVVGEVARPGLYTLAPGARVADALALAEPAEIPQSLNLAERLEDGRQIVVGGEVAPAPSDGRIDINHASAAELESLPGVGAVTAQAIIAHREQAGRFATVEDLQKVRGIGPAKFASIKDLVRVG